MHKDYGFLRVLKLKFIFLFLAPLFYSMGLFASAPNETKVGLIQPVVRPGDFDHNLKQVLASYKRLSDRGAKVVVLPEGLFPGYPSNDLLDLDYYIDASNQAAKILVEATTYSDAYLVYGQIDYNTRKRGRRLKNYLRVAYHGEVVHEQAKVLLPTNGWTDDARYFEPGSLSEIRVVDMGGFKAIFLICEDAWYNLPHDRRIIYVKNTIARVKKLANVSDAQVVITINASAYQTRKQRVRLGAPSGDIAKAVGLPLIYLNQAGVVDHLVFDGASFGVDSDGVPNFKLQDFAFDEAIINVSSNRLQPMRIDIQKSGSPFINRLRSPRFNSELETNREARIFHLREMLAQIGHDAVVFGLSGGLDSVIATVTAVDAIGTDNVFVLKMPKVGISSTQSIEYSDMLIKNLGIPDENVLTIPITEVVDAFKSTFLKLGLTSEFFDSVPFARLSMQNVQARSRMIMEYFISNLTGGATPETPPIVDALIKANAKWKRYFATRKAKIYTGDKSEALVGNSTLFGDASGVVGPNGDSTKTSLWDLAYYENQRAGWERIPHEIIEMEPTPDLAQGQKSEDNFPVYTLLDPILRDLHNKGMSPQELHAKYDGWDELVPPRFRPFVDFVLRVYGTSEHKRQIFQSPVTKLEDRTIGKETRVTIVAKKFGTIDRAACLKIMGFTSD